MFCNYLRYPSSRYIERAFRSLLSVNTTSKLYSNRKKYKNPINSIVILNARFKSDDSNVSSLFIPIPVKANHDEENVGAELTGSSLNKNDVVRVLNRFCQHPDVKSLLKDNGIDSHIQQQAFVGFRNYCLAVNNLPVDLHVILSDVLQNAGHITDIMPYFLRFAKQMFPHLDCMDDLKNISDLRSPANWYPEARLIRRKIIFHAGPTNSGKTYQALKRFLEAESGVYCGPLKMLATEVYKKANDTGTPCDLITGEERKFARNENEPASHVSCTVEMASLVNKYDVAVIDEIQMMKDPIRGWAWTRALLGLNAKEIHVCGEVGATELVRSILYTTNEEFEVFTYKRLTEMNIEDSAVCSFDNIRDGDCIVCFNKNDIYTVTTAIEDRSREVAVIYGGLPPNTKLAQAQKFNDPNNSCNVMVATDAIGMGLNLSIRRIIFYSMMKPSTNEKGEKEMDTISVSQTLQIAGRAGRFNTQYQTGYVTTFKPADLPILKQILTQKPEPIDKAGIHPTAEQIELYAYHLPHATFSNLVDIFVNLSTVDDSLYFMCAIEDFKYVADMIQHIPLPLRARYLFCCAPINKRMQFVCSMLRKYAKQYSINEPITLSWVQEHICWPLNPPKSLMELVHLESVFDVLDLYLWFSYRFQDIFVHPNPIREMQTELDQLIQNGVTQITKLLKNNNRLSSNASREEPDQFLEESNETNSAKQVAGKGRLTKKLLDTGLLTPHMLKQLEKEWMHSSKKESLHEESGLSKVTNVEKNFNLKIKPQLKTKLPPRRIPKSKK